MTTDYAKVLRETAAQLEQLPKPQKKLITHLREAAVILDKVPPAKQTLIATALRVLDPRLTALPNVGTVREDGRARHKPLSEAYPEAPIEMQARLVLGEKPASVTGLTAKEAHAFLSKRPELPNPATWLVWEALDLDRQKGAENDVLRQLHLESVPIARWLIERWRDPAQREAMLKYREERMADGQVIGGRYIDRIDELKEEDLRASVRDTYAAATVRLAKEIEKEAMRAKHQKELAPPPAWWQPIRCATLLDKPGLLAAEGKEMQHCVLTHSPGVRAKKRVIVALRVRDKEGVVHKSTVELDRDTLAVIEHRGVANVEPSKISKDALKVCLKRWKAAGEVTSPGEGVRLQNPVRRPEITWYVLP